jgi:hypothetical protein
MKILPDNPNGVYPVCVKSLGAAPKQYKQTAMAKQELTTDQLIASMLNEPEIEDESEIYKAIKNDTNGIDDGDLNHLEAEEGEDAEHDEEEGFENDEDEDDHEVPEDYGNDDDH